MEKEASPEDCQKSVIKSGNSWHPRWFGNISISFFRTNSVKSDKTDDADCNNQSNIYIKGSQHHTISRDGRLSRLMTHITHGEHELTQLITSTIDGKHD